MNRIQEGYRPDDEVYYSEHISAVFDIDGEVVYLVRSYRDYLTLKKQITETFRSREVERVGGGLYKCTLDGSFGAELIFYITDDDMSHNISIGERAREVSICDCIC
jgi:outer membrane receptor for ferrienterochelin and colicin